MNNRPENSLRMAYRDAACNALFKVVGKPDILIRHMRKCRELLGLNIISVISLSLWFGNSLLVSKHFLSDIPSILKLL